MQLLYVFIGKPFYRSPLWALFLVVFVVSHCAVFYIVMYFYLIFKKCYIKEALLHTYFYLSKESGASSTTPKSVCSQAEHEDGTVPQEIHSNRANK